MHAWIYFECWTMIWDIIFSSLFSSIEWRTFALPHLQRLHITLRILQEWVLRLLRPKLELSAPISMGWSGKSLLHARINVPHHHATIIHNFFEKHLLYVQFWKLEVGYGPIVKGNCEGFDLIPKIKYEAAYCDYNHQMKTTF